jgi:hypothetical protein
MLRSGSGTPVRIGPAKRRLFVSIWLEVRIRIQCIQQSYERLYGVLQRRAWDGRIANWSGRPDGNFGRSRAIDILSLRHGPISMLMVRAEWKRQLPLSSPFWYYQTMPRKAIQVIPKKRGRPATGRDPVTAVRLPIKMRKQIDAWAKAQPEPAPSRSEAIRRLVELGLSTSGKKAR